MRSKIFRILAFVPVPAGILAGALYFNSEVQSCKKTLCNLPVQKIENLSRIAKNAPDPIRRGEAAINITRELQAASESSDTLSSAAYEILRTQEIYTQSKIHQKASAKYMAPAEASISMQVNFIVNEAKELLKQNKRVETIPTAMNAFLIFLGVWLVPVIVVIAMHSLNIDFPLYLVADKKEEEE